MPPLFQDPLSAVPGAWRWVDLLRALIEVSCEPWALALVALAVYSWLESEVRGVLEVFLPLALALVAAGVVALAARVLGAVPRPAGAAGYALAPLLLRAFPTAQSAAMVAFGAYSGLLYGRRGRAVAAAAAALCILRALSGPHPFAEFAGGAIAGLALGAGAYGIALRLSSGGIAQRRLGRPQGKAAAGPGSP